MKINFFLVTLLIISLSVCKKEKPIEEETPPLLVDYYQKYNNPQFKLTDHPEVQGVYTMGGFGSLFRALGMSDNHPFFNTDDCTEFDPTRNKLKIRIPTEKADIEIDIINKIGDNIFLSKNRKVVRARLEFKKDTGKLYAYHVFALDEEHERQDAMRDREEMDPKKRPALIRAYGGPASPGYYKECIEFIEESIKIGKEEGKQDF